MKIKNEKKELRRTVLEDIGKFPSSYIKDADRQICEHILESDLYKDAGTIFTFITMNREIDVKPIVAQALRDKKIVCGPKCYGDGIMEAFQINDFDDIIAGTADVPEPKDGCIQIQKDDIDLILVPCLAADTGGYRLGYGGGYYDKYLESYSGHTLLLCREKQMVKEIPVEPFDIPTEFYVTETSLNLAVSDY